MIRRIFSNGRSCGHRIVSSDLQRLDAHILRDLGLDQHPGSRAEALRRREITPVAGTEDLCK
jgi:hypothetical protein